MITKLIINQAILKKIKNINIPLVVPIAFFVLEVVFFIYYRNTWYDEATYQYNGWAIYQFGWLPYQDIWLKLFLPIRIHSSYFCQNQYPLSNNHTSHF